MIHAEKVKNGSVEVMDLRSALVADYIAIDAGILERGSHRRLAVLTVERTLSHEFHADYAHSLFAYLLDVGDCFGDVVR
jgi:hypothetical protein